MTQQTNNIKKYKTLVCKQREGKREEETEYDFYLLNMTNKAVFKESTRQDTEHK